jgi:hypothetical protein
VPVDRAEKLDLAVGSDLVLVLGEVCLHV